MSEAPADVPRDDKIKLLKEFIRTRRREIGREVVPNHLLYILIGVALFVPSTAVVYFLPGIRRWFVPSAVIFMGSLAVIYVVHVLRAGFRLGKMQEELDLAQEELAHLRAQKRGRGGDMKIRSSFAHVNLITTDLSALSAFYQQVFGCVVVTPDHLLAGSWVEAITGVPGAQIRVAHLRLPGCGEQGPTLELIQYSDALERPATASNRPGLGHIAFAVDDVEVARDAVIAAGGSAVGDIVTVEISGRGRVTEVYVTDPEGNILELQRWS